MADGRRTEVLAIGRVSVDLYPQQMGPLAEVTTFQKAVGGTATNVAIAAARLGHRVALVTKVGDDPFGAYVRHALSTDFDIDVSFVGTQAGLATPLAIAELDPPEDPSIQFYRAPRAPDELLTVSDIPWDAVESADLLWVTGSRFAFEPSAATTLEVLRRREHRAHVVLDLDYRAAFWRSEPDAGAAISAALEHVTVAVGNRDEARITVGTADPALAAQRLLDHGVRLAIIKMGGDGVWVATNDGMAEQIEAVPVDVVCGLGAGDAFGGMLCHGLLEGWAPQRTARYANAAGAIVAGRLMCSEAMPTLAEVDAAVTSEAPPA